MWQDTQGRLLPASPSSRAPGGPQLVALLSSLAASTWVPGRPNAQQFQPDFFTSVTSAKTLIKIRSDSEVPGVVTWASFLAVRLFVCLFLGVAVHSSTHCTYFLFLLSRHFLGVWCVPWAPSMGEGGAQALRNG